MDPQGLSATEMRVAMILVGIVVLALIYWFGKARKPAHRRRSSSRSAERLEPTLGDDVEIDLDEEADDAAEPRQGELAVDSTGESPADDTPVRAKSATARRPPSTGVSAAGKRPSQQAVERIVTLFVVPRRSELRFRGSELVVAAEKAGLEFGDLGIFHRMLDGKRELGPIFSAANMVKPGHFDMTHIKGMEAPGLSIFMTLPGPLPALDGWDTMLPTAQRIAELLEGQVVDEDHNTLGRQGIAYIRDDLRAWDRRHDGD